MLNLTKNERRALLIVGIVILGSVVVQWIMPHTVKREIYDYSLEDSLFKALSDDTADIEARLKSLERQKRKNILKPNSININTADAKLLKKLPRIGPVTAGNILDYRNEHGPFKRLEDLKKVNRIGPKTLERIRPYLFIAPDSS